MAALLAVAVAMVDKTRSITTGVVPLGYDHQSGVAAMWMYGPR